jgi:hypothetical protein
MTPREIGVRLGDQPVQVDSSPARRTCRSPYDDPSSRPAPSSNDLDHVRRRFLRPGQAGKGPGHPIRKLAVTYRAAVVLSSCITWTRV